MKISKATDFGFGTTFMTWKRLERDVRVPDIFSSALTGIAFDCIDVRIFEEVVSRNPLVSLDALWTLLRVKISNESPIMSLRSQFMTVRWNKRKEFVQAYISKLQNMTMNLTENISDDILGGILIQELWSRIKLSDLGVQEKYDEFVGRVSLIAAEFGMGRKSLKER